MGSDAQRVWCPVDDADAWVLATVDEKFGGSVHMKRLHAPDGFELDLMVSDETFSRLMPVTGKDDELIQSDMVHLHDVNEAGMLHNLRQRYMRDDIYTAIGPILVSLNPYKPLDVCLPEHVSALMEKSAVVEKESQRNEANPEPHVFRTARSAYVDLCLTGRAQSILISGESGAGKTECCKLSLSCLASVSGSSGVTTEAALESGILLEAFGNAKTVMNDNSSRFGKWCVVHFDKDAKIARCKLQSYLLEQTRVVGQAKGERNYHIFYQMSHASAEKKAAYGILPDASQYEVLRTTLLAPGVDDAAGWDLTLGGLDLFGLAAEQAAHLLCALSAVMMIGNVTFTAPFTAKDQCCEATPSSGVEMVAQLLQVELRALIHSLTHRTISSGRGSSYTLPLTSSQCNDARDALSRAVYAGLFELLIARLNEHMANLGGATVDDESEHFVGLLDVFGFENFEYNGFEQLCINFTNEKLQQHFIDAVIKLQQQDYEREGITCAHIQFPDNISQIELIEGKRGALGILSLLDEECRIQQGSEEAYVTKMHEAFPHHEHYARPKPTVSKRAGTKGAATSDGAMGVAEKDLFKLRFVVHHYAGEVAYTAYQWLDKNRGVVRPELLGLLMDSGNPLLAACFGEAALTTDRDAKGKPLSVSGAFRASLRQLSATLLQTSARYVRCIKPNVEKKPGVFDGHFVERQLRYTGVGAVIEIQRSGYPIAIVKADFVRRYRCCCLGTAVDADVDVATRQVLAAVQQAAGVPGSWLSELAAQLGKTKIFMRDEVVRALETRRDVMQDRAATMLSREARRRLARRAATQLRASSALCGRLREQLDAHEVEAASVTLDEARALWDAAASLPSLFNSAARAQRQLGQLEMALQHMEGLVHEEREVLGALHAALAAHAAGEEGCFVELRSACGAAHEVAEQHMLLLPLREAISAAEAAIAAEELLIRQQEESEQRRKAVAEAAAAEAKLKAAEAKTAAEKAAAEAAEREAAAQLASTAAKIEEFKAWEAEVERQAAEREALRRQRERLEGEKESQLGEGMERLELVVRNDPDPEKGMGVHLSLATVTAVVRGGVAAREGLLRVGDIVEKVDGVSVRGKKVMALVPENATSVKLTVVRSQDASAPEVSDASAPRAVVGQNGVEMSGWLFKVKAKDGRAVRLPKKRWVVLHGSLLVWYEDSRGEVEANQQSLRGAVCSMPLRSTGYAMTPAMRAFAELHKFPFMLSWPNGEVGHEIVFAASTNPDRSHWVNALIDAIKRTQNDTPTAGWLFKEGGRKTGIALAGWKKRWFVLVPPGKEGGAAQLRYFESPQSKKPKGAIVLKGSDVFVPKKMRGPSGSSYQHCFCVTSTGVQEGQDAGSRQPTTTCTLLAASSDDDRQKWIHATRALMMASDAHKGHVKSGSVRRA